MLGGEDQAAIAGPGRSGGEPAEGKQPMGPRGSKEAIRCSTVQTRVGSTPRLRGASMISAWTNRSCGQARIAVTGSLPRRDRCWFALNDHEPVDIIERLPTRRTECSQSLYRGAALRRPITELSLLYVLWQRPSSAGLAI